MTAPVVTSNELLGDDLELQWDNAANYTTPTWNKEVSVGDVGFDPGKKLVEIPLRIAFVTYKTGRADWKLTFTMNVNKGDDFYKAVMDSITNGTKIHLAFTDSGTLTVNTNTSDYWHAWFICKGPVKGSLDNAATVDVEASISHDRGAGGTQVPAFVLAAA